MNESTIINSWSRYFQNLSSKNTTRGINLGEAYFGLPICGHSMKKAGATKVMCMSKVTASHKIQIRIY